jgi:hypothetical protein
MQTLVEFDQIGCKTSDIFFGGIRTLNQCVCKWFKFSIRLRVMNFEEVIITFLSKFKFSSYIYISTNV